jgi:RNA polymerase sigma-70 factor (ECF subfamily)
VTDDDFCALYDRHARRLWAYVARMTHSPTAADDIVQESFLRVYEAAALVDATDDHRRRYLYTVATNLVRRRGRTELRHDDDWQEPASDGLDIDERLAVRQALHALPLVERQALWLAYVERWSSRELAAMLGYREGSMRQVVTRARRHFAAMFTRGAQEDDRGTR